MTILKNMITIAVVESLQAECDELREDNMRIDNDGREFRRAYSDLQNEVDELRAKLKEKDLIIFDHEIADYKGEVEMLKAKLADAQASPLSEEAMDILQSENARLSALCDKWNSEGDELRTENTQLCEKLAALENDCICKQQRRYSDKPVYTSNCSRHPAAPHSIDLEASFRAGRTVCACQSWATGEAS